MKKLYLYGAGKALNTYLYPDISDWINSNYMISGIIDKNIKLEGKEILVGNKAVRIERELPDNNIEIYITSKRYYGEIREELIHKGISEKSILPESYLYYQYLKETFNTKYFKGKGIEIGGPSDIFDSIYKNCAGCDGINFSSDTVWGKNVGGLYKYKNYILGNLMIADVTQIDVVKDEEYDFVLSSNNLEHVANPIKAVYEMNRITKAKGVLLLVVPNKKYTFDHKREFTSFEHLCEDYKNFIQENDLFHLKEILEKHDFSMDINISIDDFKKRSEHNFENRCLHHHVFNQETLNKVIQLCGFSVLEYGEVLNNLYVLGHKKEYGKNL